MATMSYINKPLCDHLFGAISLFSAKQFTGEIKIQLSSKDQVLIYLNLGALAWVSDCVDSPRRYKRHLMNAGLSPTTFQEIMGWEYKNLVTLARSKRLDQVQVQQIISEMAQEILFDLLQKAQATSSNHFPFEISSQAGIRPSSDLCLPHTWLCSLTSVEQKTRISYQKWSSLGLENYSPNLTPVITNHELFLRAVSAETYQNLGALLNGKYTLREIAARRQEDFITVIEPLSPLIKKGIIDLIPLSKSTPRPNRLNSSHTPLKVLAISDIQHNTDLLEALTLKEGCQFKSIRHSIDALSLLAEYSPDLIFIDLFKFPLNNNNLCAKIRKLENFQNVPIVVIVKKGMWGKASARLIGASECLEKPLVTHQVKGVLNRYQKQKKRPLTAVDNSSPS